MSLLDLASRLQCETAVFPLIQLRGILAIYENQDVATTIEEEVILDVKVGGAAPTPPTSSWNRRRFLVFDLGSGRIAGILYRRNVCESLMLSRL